jgi:peptide/nickel transport system permease protein
MSDRSDKSRTDGGVSDSSETFEQVDWEDIDRETNEKTWGDYLWLGTLTVWTLVFITDFLSRRLSETTIELGPGETVIGGSEVLLGISFGEGEALGLPLIGKVAQVDWLWLITILILINYGARPLYNRPRMAKKYWKDFRKNKAAVISGLFLVVIFLVGVIGSRIFPKLDQDPAIANQPPVGLSIERYATGVECAGETTTRSDGIQMCHGSMEHPLGTTPSGEDVLLGIIRGMEVSLQVGLIATLISIGIAAGVALAAAFYGGLIDEALMRYVDIQQTFPTLFLFLLLAYTIGGGLFTLIMIFGFFGWGAYARIMRAEALQRREEMYLTAAKSAGAGTWWSMRRHLLPNISNSIITAATLSIPSIILAEAAISFLGLGDPSVASWGRIIADGRDELGRAWWTSTFPGIFLFFTVLAFNFLGDALRDALDPRHGGGE